MSLVASELVFSGSAQSDVRESRITDDVLLPLVRRAVLDDPAATRLLVHRIAPRLLRTVRQVLGPDHSDLEDVAQDAVIGFLQAMPEFRAESSVLHFAHRIALLTALAARRKNGTRERRIASDPYDDVLVQDQRSCPHIDLM